MGGSWHFPSNGAIAKILLPDLDRFFKVILFLFLYYFLFCITSNLLRESQPHKRFSRSLANKRQVENIES